MLFLAKIFKTNFKDNSGFTLIELLVVIAIIGLLATVIMTSLNFTGKKARDTRRIKDAQAIYKAVQLFYDNNDHFPCYESGDPTYVYIRESSTVDNNCLLRDLEPYLKQVPYDPGGAHANYSPYEYQRDSHAQAFYIEVTLEKRDYNPKVNYVLSGSCAKSGLSSCGIYGYCTIVPRNLGGSGCGYQYIIGEQI